MDGFFCFRLLLQIGQFSAFQVAPIIFAEEELDELANHWDKAKEALGTLELSCESVPTSVAGPGFLWRMLRRLSFQALVDAALLAAIAVVVYGTYASARSPVASTPL